MNLSMRNGHKRKFWLLSYKQKVECKSSVAINRIINESLTVRS